jgi:methionine-gamma-lyase
MSQSDFKGFATRQIHAKSQKYADAAPLTTPIFQTSTFKFASCAQGAARFAGEEEGYIYSRIGNPNSNEVAARIADLEGAQAGIAMSSGMGAISATLWTLLQAGDHVLADKTLYGCTFDLFNHGFPRYGIKTDFIDTTDLKAVKAGLKPNTKIVYFETFANPDLKMPDIAAISAIVHAYNPAIKVVVDNTFATPYLVRPIELGADVVVHSATKFLNGHGDILAGIVVGSKELMTEITMYGLKDATGAVLGPFEAFLLTRGLKTLDIRMQRHCDNGLQVARFLEGHPAVARVLYPGLPSHPQYQLAKSLLKNGFGGEVTFELACSRERTAEFIDGLELCAIAVSLGSTDTHIEQPATMTHSSYTAEELAAAGLRESMIRLSVGLENAEDIIADLKKGLDRI